MDERLLPDKPRYVKSIIVPTITRQDKTPAQDKLHFKSYDDLLTDGLASESNSKLRDAAKSKSENTLLAQYRHKRASKAEEELFDLENGDECEDSLEYECETSQGVERIAMDETDDQMDADELNAEYIIERQIVDTLLSPPIIVRAPSQSSSINTSFNYHHRKLRGGSLYRKLRKRAIDKNGTGNIIQINISKRRRAFLVDIFTTLVDIQWRWTLLVCSMGFLLSWLGFACVWWLLAFTHGDLLPENEHNPQFVPCVVGVDSFVASLLFSIETQHTIGYGSRATTTECPEAIWLMCAQSIAGTLIQAFMTGLVFAKVARPKQRTQTLLFSRTAVINQRDGYLCLMFRVGDMREKSHIIGASVKAYLVKQRTTAEGEVLNPFLSELKLHIDSYDSDIFLLWPTIVVHRIDEASPLYDMSAKKLLTEKFEIIAILEGTTESTGQTTQAKTSYLPSEILWGHRFENLLRYNREKIVYEVDYALFHNTNQVDTPLCSAKELQEFTKMGQ